MPVFGSEVELITVDAVVLNKFGKAVPGLTREDFQVTEDGRPVEIVSFEAVVEPDEEPQPADGVVAVRGRQQRAARSSRPPAGRSRS